jgi:hypothetical protein
MYLKVLNFNNCIIIYVIRFIIIFNYYSIIEYDYNDCLFIENKNKVLKKWLSDLNRKL